MLEENQTQSGEENQQSAETQENQEELIVKKSAEELTKRLKDVSSEAREYRKRLADEKRKSETLEKEKLESQGKYQELANQWKREAEEQKKKTESILGAFATQTIKTKIASEASKMGCIDVDALIQLMPADSIPIDDNFNVDMDSLRLNLDEAKKARQYLFTKAAPAVKDAVPNNKPQPTKAKDLSQLSTRELAEMLSKFKQ